MKGRLIAYSIFLPVGLFALSLGSAMAKPGIVKSKTVDVVYQAKLGNGPELQPGQYKLAVSEASSTPEVMFYQDNKLVAEAPVKLVDMGKKADATEIDYNRGSNQQVITSIRLDGWNQEIVLPGATGNTSHSGS
jgi:hypothetical protein